LEALAFSGVNGEELKLRELRGEGVRGILSVPVRFEKIPLWVLAGLDPAAVAMINVYI
jgi:hypothetical protein